MKPLRHIASLVLALAVIVGGLMSCEVIPKQQFEDLPAWLQVTLFVCLSICAIATLWGFIDDYLQIRQARGDK